MTGGDLTQSGALVEGKSKFQLLLVVERVLERAVAGAVLGGRLDSSPGG